MFLNVFLWMFVGVRAQIRAALLVVEFAVVCWLVVHSREKRVRCKQVPEAAKHVEHIKCVDTRHQRPAAACTHLTMTAQRVHSDSHTGFHLRRVLSLFFLFPFFFFLPPMTGEAGFATDTAEQVMVPLASMGKFVSSQL